MPTLHIYGVGGFGRELLAPALEILEAERSSTNPRFEDVAFLDDRALQKEVLGQPVQGPDEMRPGDYFVLGVGDGRLREKLHMNCLARGALPFSFISTFARIGRGVEMDEGAVLTDFTMVTASATIGRQFQCNIYSYVAHDCRIGNFVTFAPKVCCNGNVRVGDYAYVGTGAVIKQGTPDKPRIIGEGAIIGMGAVVTKDVPAGTVVVGNPARAREMT